MKYYVVKYSGPFGFIKPWTAVRDELTYSQTFLSPSTVKGISQKLFGIGEMQRIQRYRLQFGVMSQQQEQTWAPLRKISSKKGVKSLNNGVITRGVLLNPVLYLAFANQDDAHKASEQHICLCRNEDILLPDINQSVKEYSKKDFDKLKGFELVESQETMDIPVGFDRYSDETSMSYGKLLVVG